MRLSRWASVAVFVNAVAALAFSSSVQGLQVRKDDGLQTNVCLGLNDALLVVLISDA
jgi:hypothetical protein